MTHTPAAVRLKKGRTALLLDCPFYGTLLFRLKTQQSHSLRTMATDGVHLFYNAAFVESLTPAELNGVLAHEVMHPALQHHTRRGNRSPKRWNRACDLAINPIILESGLTLPKDALVDARFVGMNAERIYNKLVEEEDGHEESGNDQGDGSSQAGGSSASGGNGMQPDPSDDQKNAAAADQKEPTAPETPGGFGQVLDPPNEKQPGEAATPEEIHAQELDWQIAVEQAETIARAQGKLPAGAERAVADSGKAAVDWREALRRAFAATIPSDYAWSRPNRRHIWSGLYLPGMIREGIGEIAIAVDCSGSISSRQLGAFQHEMNAILAEHPNRVHVLYFDAIVQKAEVVEQGQPIDLRPVGGGGTDFCPVFSFIEEHGLQPQTMIFLTDLAGTFPSSEPSYPVIWASTDPGRAPFGETVPMEAA